MRALLVFTFCLGMTFGRAEDRILVDATINGQSVRLGFDTAASESTLFRGTAKRLKLKISDPPPNFQPAPGQVAAGYTEPCEFEFGTLKARWEFRVVEFPPELSVGMSIEGVLAWAPFKNKVLSIDAWSHRASIADTGADRAVGWPKFKLRKDEPILAFEVAGSESPQRVAHVDTGSEEGVTLPPILWKKWIATHTNQPVTMTASFTPGTGLLVKQEMWAGEISLGSLVIKEVPVREEDVKESLVWKSEHAATLGLYALRRVDMVVDGPNEIVYLRPRSGPAPAYTHNRLGAVFTPRDMQSDPLLAHVAPRSPAFYAGVKDDDTLLKIDDLDVTKWHTDPRVMPMSRFWDAPAGTSYQLTLRRGDRVSKVKVILRDLLGYGLDKRLD